MNTLDRHENDVLDALREELAAVTVSPDFATKVRTQILAEAQEDELGALGRELSSVSVSPAFAARVRQGIENVPPRTGWLSFLNWRWAVPAAAAAAIALTLVVWRTGNDMPGPIVAKGPSTDATTLGVQAPVFTPEPAVSFNTARVPATRRTATATVASGQQGDDKLEVITYQPAVYRQMWAAAAATEVVKVAELPLEVREVAIASFEVGPVVVQWLVEPPKAPGGSVPEVRRISADAERSGK